MIIILKKRVNFLVIIFLLLIFSSTRGLAVAEELSTANMVKLSGILSVRNFVDANDKVEKEYVLTVKPIDVVKDEFGGPVKHVTEIQLVMPRKIEEKKFIDKTIEVKGVLFYPITAHHHTKVLMEVKSVALFTSEKSQ